MWSSETAAFDQSSRRRVSTLTLFALGLVALAFALPAGAAAMHSGGSGWSRQNPGIFDNPLHGIACVDATHAWAIGSDGIISTTDGGATWRTQIPGGPDSFWDITFVDADYGWAAAAGPGGGDILHTTDGGATWTPQYLPPGPKGVWAIDFVDRTHGWAVGDQGLIVATTDGGATWVRQSVGSPQSSDRLAGVAFADATHGWAVGKRGEWPDSLVHADILATTNGGATWTLQFSESYAAPSFVGVACTDLAHAWVAVQSGGILATTDGGASCRDQKLPRSQMGQLTCIDFRDSLHGWAGGPQGTIIATIDGGKTWRWRGGPYSVDVNDIAFADATHGWAVGVADSLTPAILATTTGGVPLTPTPGSKPVLAKLSPTAARRGAAVTLTGSGFGAKRGTSVVKFGKKACTKYLSWSATRIKVRVPAKAVFGKVKVAVRTAGGTSGSRIFTVKR